MLINYAYTITSIHNMKDHMNFQASVQNIWPHIERSITQCEESQTMPDGLEVIAALYGNGISQLLTGKSMFSGVVSKEFQVKLTSSDELSGEGLLMTMLSLGQFCRRFGQFSPGDEKLDVSAAIEQVKDSVVELGADVDLSDASQFVFNAIMISELGFTPLSDEIDVRNTI